MWIASDDDRQIAAAAHAAPDGNHLRVGGPGENAAVAAVEITVEGTDQGVRRSHISAQRGRIADAGFDRAARPDIEHVVPIGINSAEHFNGVSCRRWSVSEMRQSRYPSVRTMRGVIAP